MTHPPSAPAPPPRPAGPRLPRVSPLDPTSPEGRQIADDLSQVLAEIELAIRQRDSAAEQVAAHPTTERTRMSTPPTAPAPIQPGRPGQSGPNAPKPTPRAA